MEIYFIVMSLDLSIIIALQVSFIQSLLYKQSD